MGVEDRPAARVDDDNEIRTWGELDNWLQGRIIHSRAYLDDPETAQAYGHDVQVKHQARFLAYREVRARIAPRVTSERVARVVDEAYRAAGFEHMDPLEQRIMDGDR